MRQLQPKPDYGEDSYRGYGRLTGQVALITEAESGVGRAVALAFAREGADLALSALEQNADIDETARLVKHAGRRAVVICGDVRDEDYRQFLVKNTIVRLGHLDGLVTSSAAQDHRDATARILAAIRSGYAAGQARSACGGRASLCVPGFFGG